MNELIGKYERFEYKGYLCHYPELGIWIKE